MIALGSISVPVISDSVLKIPVQYNCIGMDTTKTYVCGLQEIDGIYHYDVNIIIHFGKSNCGPVSA